MQETKQKTKWKKNAHKHYATKLQKLIVLISKKIL